MLILKSPEVLEIKEDIETLSWLTNPGKKLILFINLSSVSILFLSISRLFAVF